jgi:cytochrome c
MKRWILTLFALAALVQFAFALDKGEAVYQELRCGTCHAKTGEFQKTPSLEQIAKAYGGDQAALVSYLKGEAEPIVIPERGGSMKRQIKKTEALPEEDRTQLADFILGFQ